MVDFIPLELWRASSLTSETKGVIAAYERCLAQGDFEALAALRAAIEGRIAELEDFYTAHLDDERALLFDKQRMKLRKLLHEYDNAVASLQAQGGGAGAGYGGGGSSSASAAPSAASSPSGAGALAAHLSMGGSGFGGGGGGAHGGGGAPGSVTRDVTENSRLTLVELTAWFTQVGFAELRDRSAGGEIRAEVTLPVLQQVFRNVTRTNLDGKMSIRDVRQWYISYGKRSLLEKIGNFDGELVPVKLLKTTAAGGGPAAAARRAAAPLPALSKGLYTWEQEQKQKEEAAAAGASAGAAAGQHHREHSAPASGSAASFGAAAAAVAAAEAADAAHRVEAGAAGGLPNHMLELQVRLTAEEYKAMCVRRRQYEGELRFKARIERAEAAKKALRGRQIGAEVPSSLRDTAFADRSEPTNYLFRSDIHS